MSTTLLKLSHNQVFHNNPQYLNLHAWLLGVHSAKNKGFSVEVADRMQPFSGHHQGLSTNQSGPYWKSGAEEFGGHLPFYETSDFFMFLSKDLDRHPSTIDDYRTAIVDSLGAARPHISQSSKLNRLVTSYPRDRPKSSRNLSIVLSERINYLAYLW